MGRALGFAMLSNAVIMAIGLVFLSNHLLNHGRQAKSFLLHAWRFLNRTSELIQAGTKDLSREEQVNKAVWDLRERTYKHVVSFLVHQMALVVLLSAYELSLNPDFTHLVRLLWMFCIYLAHHSVCSGRLTLNSRNLRVIYTIFYLSFISFVFIDLFQDDIDEAKAITKQAFHAGARMCLVQRQKES